MVKFVFLNDAVKVLFFSPVLKKSDHLDHT